MTITSQVVGPTTDSEALTPAATRDIPTIHPPDHPAHVIQSDSEAISIAERLATDFAREVVERETERRRPIQELDAFSQSGLWSINVPKRFGGPEISYATLMKVIEIISAADSSLGQIPQNHWGVVAAIQTVSDEAQQRLLFEKVLRGIRFGNAFSEYGSRIAAEFETQFVEDGDDVIVNGRKFYSTGALLAHLIPIVALDDLGRAWYAIAERDTPGLTIIDDWSSFGQRNTFSGTVVLENVRVPKTHLVPGYKGYENPTADGAIFQIIQAAVDTGIARGAIEEAIRFVRGSSRPWVDSGVDHAWEDPYTIQIIGDLSIRLRATQALLEKAGLAIDHAVAEPNEVTVVEAQLAVAAAKVLSTELAIDAANRLFEVGGTRSTLERHHLDRYWRNARVHTLHDPVRWKYAIVGNHALNGVNPPLHAWS